MSRRLLTFDYDDKEYFEVARSKNAPDERFEPNFGDIILLNWLDHMTIDFEYDGVINKIKTSGIDLGVHREYIDYIDKKLDTFEPPAHRRPFLMEVLDEMDADHVKHLIRPIPRKIEFYKSVEILTDMLDLSNVEKMMLQFAAFAYHSSYAYQQIFYEFRMPKDENLLISHLFNIPMDEVKTLKDSFLVKSGILRRSDDGFKSLYGINEDFGEILVPAPTYTLDDLVDKLFPSNLTSDLDKSSFPHLSKEIAITENIISKSLSTNGKGMNIMFWGMPGVGKTEMALVLAKANNWNLRVIGDISQKDMEEKNRAQRLASLKIAMKLYANDKKTVLLFDEIEDIFNKQDNHAQFSKAFINHLIETTPIPIIWTTNVLKILGQPLLRRMIYNIEFKIPPISARKEIWKNYDKKYELGINDDTLDDLASEFKISPAIIHNTAKITKMSELDTETIPTVISSLEKLVNYGEEKKLPPKHCTDIPYDLSFINTTANLQKLSDRMVELNNGFSMLLYGVSGSGKSEYARYLAKRMNRKVLYKRYSDLASPFVGMTEINIAAAFEEAKEDKMALIIDEGDTFLMDRHNAQRSWEITVVNEFLSQMEAHTEPFFLTSNMFDNIDPAAMRRFDFKLKFESLNATQTANMFRKFFNLEPPAMLARLDSLTPGDFSLVLKKAKVLQCENAQELYEMLFEEHETKHVSGKIGF